MDLLKIVYEEFLQIKNSGKVFKMRRKNEGSKGRGTKGMIREKKNE